jgi:DNA ligase 1
MPTISSFASAHGAMDVVADYVRLGDWGLVAQESRSKQRYISAANRLSVDYVYKVFQEICGIKGHSSQMLKREKIKRLLSRCHEEEAKFIVRSLQVHTKKIHSESCTS